MFQTVGDGTRCPRPTSSPGIRRRPQSDCPAEPNNQSPDRARDRWSPRHRTRGSLGQSAPSDQRDIEVAVVDGQVVFRHEWWHGAEALQERRQLLGRDRLGGDGDDLRAGEPAPSSYQSQIDAERSSTLMTTPAKPYFSVGSCAGRSTSTPLRWTGVPAGTGSVAVVVEDPDAPAATYTHWVVVNIAPTVSTTSVVPATVVPSNYGHYRADRCGAEDGSERTPVLPYPLWTRRGRRASCHQATGGETIARRADRTRLCRLTDRGRQLDAEGGSFVHGRVDRQRLQSERRVQRVNDAPIRTRQRFAAG
jgi:hypothetical protein